MIALFNVILLVIFGTLAGIIGGLIIIGGIVAYKVVQRLWEMRNE